jgi:hypothetical protein
MNSLTYSTNFSARNDNLSLGGTATTTTNLSSSNGLADSQTVTSSAWTQLTTAGPTDVRAIWLFNDNATYSSSFISIATGSAGQGVFTILKSGDSAIIPWSGSYPGLYAKIVPGGTDINGVVQYSLVQS